MFFALRKKKGSLRTINLKVLWGNKKNGSSVELSWNPVLGILFLRVPNMQTREKIKIRAVHDLIHKVQTGLDWNYVYWWIIHHKTRNMQLKHRSAKKKKKSQSSFTRSHIHSKPIRTFVHFQNMSKNILMKPEETPLKVHSPKTLMHQKN